MSSGFKTTFNSEFINETDVFLRLNTFYFLAAEKDSLWTEQVADLWSSFIENRKGSLEAPHSQTSTYTVCDVLIIFITNAAKK